MSRPVLEAERAHLAGLLEAIQRCVYFLDASERKLAWPLTLNALETHKNEQLKHIAGALHTIALAQFAVFSYMGLIKL